jgi:hypothetical protein
MLPEAHAFRLFNKIHSSFIMPRCKGTTQCPNCQSWFKGRKGLSIHQQRSYPACQPSRQYNPLPLANTNQQESVVKSCDDRQNMIRRNIQEDDGSEDEEWVIHNHDNNLVQERLGNFENSSSDSNDDNEDSSMDESVKESSNSGDETSNCFPTLSQEIINDYQHGDEMDISNTMDNSPDESILQEYEEMLLSGMYGNNTSIYSTDEKVQLDLLQLLKKLKAPLKTFKEVLNWASRASSAGYCFTKKQPSRKAVLNRLYQKQSMKQLLPRVAQLRLPHSKQIVNVTYFDAKAVFTSMLSCPILNRDENFLFHSNNPFSPPPKNGSFVGDINTSAGYKATYEALVKNPNEDVILPCILSMDKTQCDTYGRLAMEPITISYGLMKHQIRSSPLAMRVLGYINHEPLHEHEESMNNDQYMNPETTSSDMNIHTVPHISLPNVRSEKSCQKLNDYHAQIYFILKQSGFLHLQNSGFRWKLHFQENQVCK